MTALRVYLFADFGKGPRVVGRALPLNYYGNNNRGPNFHYSRARRPTHERFGDYWLTLKAARTFRSMATARRWWLVECASAADGRVVIEQAELGTTSGHNYGRILASGGSK